MTDVTLPLMLTFIGAAPATPAAPVAARMLRSSDLITSSSLDTDFDRQDIVDSLAMAAATDDPNAPPSRERRLLDLMADPAHAGASLPSMMKESGLILHEMLELMRRKSVAMAMMRSARHMGDVVDGLGEFGKPTWAICATCQGEGSIIIEGESESVICPADECQDGKVRRIGNLDAAKLFLEVHGMRKGSGNGGAGVNVNVGVRTGDVSVDAQKSAKQESITSRVQSILEG